MEIIRDAGLDELTALCGGCCSCATCHVHVDPVSLDALAPMSDDERAMLEDSTHFNEYSRLSCQLRLQDGVSQLRLTISQDD
jgi:2Fe-2S ferredoxin